MTIERPTRELLARAVAAVRAGVHPDGPLHVEEAFCVPFGDGIAIYFDDVCPGDLPIGGIYKTFIVRFAGTAAELAGVSFYRSRVDPEGGRTTLPP